MLTNTQARIAFDKVASKHPRALRKAWSAARKVQAHRKSYYVARVD
jgi:hypothetical protein